MTSRTADTLFLNGRIYTMDPARPWAEAMAVSRGRIIAVGRGVDLDGLAGPHTRIVNLQGRMALPGLGDIHNHHARGGELDLFELNFPPDTAFDDILALVNAKAKVVGPDEWITGGTWGSSLGSRLMDPAARLALDAASLGRPVSLIDESLHNRWVNSRALDLAGITRDTPDPQDGQILRDAAGEATGFLVEKAMALATRAATATLADPVARMAANCQRGVSILNGYGVTFFQDATTTAEMMQALCALDLGGDLNAWVVTSLPAYDTLQGTSLFGEALIARAKSLQSRHLRAGFVKLFADGVPMTRTGAMLDAYLPAEDGSVTVCPPFLSVPALVGWIRIAARHGLGIKVHCAGDAAVRVVLDAVEVVRSIDGEGPTHHIAHAGFVHPHDIHRFKELNVLADLCPALWVKSPLVAAIAEVLPKERADRYWPLADMHRAGVAMAGGSDWPVVGQPDPWFAMEGMVTRINPKMPELGPMWPEQSLDLETVLQIFTINAARGMGLSHETGSLQIGKSADMIVIDQDLFSVPASFISKTKVLETWFEGRLVFGR